MATNRLHNLDLSTLRSFVTIAESGSMTRAAGRLFMTQSAISMQIKRLEQSLGLTVFDRSAQGMTTTTEGEQLLHFASQMLAINDEAMGRLTSPDYEGQIRLGVPCDIIYPHIPWVLKDFSRDYPRVQIKLSSGSTLSLKKQFRQGLLDVVLTTERVASQGGRIIATQSLVWTGAEDGVAWKQRPLPLGISKNCAFRDSATKALDDGNFEWVDVVATADDIAALAMVSADLCISAELESVKNPSRVTIEHGGQLPELPEFSIMLYSINAHDNNLAELLVEYLLHSSS
ncbi:MAG: LysR family transcriptional regulator [Gammaproteobacteria bacterium]|nr:LysR family transcriptional regulator [Gammaproteobacteria bacterium]